MKDERLVIAEKIFKATDEFKEQGIDLEYALYIIFCLTGSFILERNKTIFEKYVQEIKERDEKYVQ